MDDEKKTKKQLVDELAVLRQRVDALRLSETRYREMFEAAPLAVFRSMPDGKPLDVNPEFLRLFGYSSREEFFTLVRNASEIFAEPGRRDEIRREMAEKAAPARFENRYRRKDGSEFISSLNIRAVRDSQGAAQYFEGFIEDITERKRAEEQLNFQSSLVDNAPDAIIAMDVNEMIKIWNATAEAMYGWSAQEVVGHYLREIIRDEYMGITEEDVNRQLAEKGVWKGELFQVRRDGVKFPIQASVSVVKDRLGKLVGYVAINRDISERKRVEEQLYFQSSLVDNASDAIVAHDVNLVITSWNAAAEALYGIPAHEAIGRNLREIVHDEYPGSTEEETHRQLIEKGSWNGELFHIRRDGVKIPLQASVSVVKDRQGRQVGYVAINRDITERKRSEDARRTAEANYRSIFENATVGIFQSTPEGRFTNVNPSLARLYGYDSPEEMLVGVTDISSQIYVDPSSRKELQHQLAEQGEVTEFIGENYRKDGSIIWTLTSARAVKDDKSQILYYEGFITDITARKRMERAIYLMSDTQRQIAHLDNLMELYQLVGKRIQELIGDGYVTVSMLDERIQAMRVVGMYGFGRLYENLVQKFKVDPSRMVYSLKDMTDDELRQFRSGQLEKFEGGLYRMTTRKIPRRICEAAEKQLKLTGIYTMGFVEHDKHFGGFTLLARGDITPYKEMIETIINQAAIAMKRIRSEEALRESEERYRLLAETSPDMIFMVNPEDTVTYVNSVAAHSVGRQPADIIGNRVEYFFPAEIAQRQLNNLHQVFENGQPLSLENNSIFQGKTKWMDTWLVPIKDSGGAVVSVMGISRDVTEHRQAEEALKESESTLRSFINALPDPAFLIAWDKSAIIVNQSFAQRFGKSGDELVGTALFDLLPPDLAQQRKAQIDQVFRTGQPIVFEDARASHDYINYISPVPDAAGEVSRVAVFALDITGRKRAEEALRESEERFRLSFELAPIGMALILPDGKYIRVNQALCKLFEYTAEEMVGFRWEGASYPDEEERKQNLLGREKLVKKQIADFQMEKRFITKTGKLIRSLLHITLVRDAQDEPLYFLAQVVDITERKLLEVQMLNSEKLAGLGTLAAGIAHELNSPLQVITGLSESAGKRIGRGEIDQERLSQNLETIRRNGWRCAEIIRSLLAYARPDAGQRESHDFNVLVGDTLLLIEHQLKSWSNITVTTQLGDNLPLLYCNRNQISQVLINLMTNSADAMPIGGEITIRTGYDRERKHFSLKVSDTGFGMPKEVQSHIFNPFYTTKEVGKGTGLGLFIIQGIVRARGGEIEVESVEKEGTTFTIFLPLEPPVPNPEGAEDQTGRYRLG